MFRYFACLHEKFDAPIYPIVLFSYDQPKKQAINNYQVDFPDFEVLRFNYRTIQLNRLNWRDFLNIKKAKLVYDLLAVLEARQQTQKDLEPEERELIMQLSPIYRHRLEEVTQQGRQEGLQQGRQEERRHFYELS